MRRESKPQSSLSWRVGFRDGMAGTRLPTGDRVAYHSGYLAGLAQRTTQKTMMAVALASVALPPTTPSPRQADTTLAAIDEHRQAWDALTRGSTNCDDWHQAFMTAEAKLVESRPVTADGLMALREYEQEARRRRAPYPSFQPPEYSGGKA